jgi:hypothetical protein
VKSVLSCGNEDVKALIQHIVNQRSIAESLGNAVFTMAALSIFNELDRGLEKASFPEEFLNQTTMLACLRAVLVDEKDASRPSAITSRT